MIHELNTELKKLIAGLLYLLVGVPAQHLYRGFTFACLWEWFAVPLGTTPVTTLQATGLGLFIAVLRMDRKDDTPMLEKMLAVFGVLSFTLAFGYVVHLCM